MTPLFEAVIEATEEAIYNSLFSAETITGKNGTVVKVLPIKETITIIKNHIIIKQ